MVHDLMDANTVEFAMEDAGAKRFGIIVDNTAYGLGILQNARVKIEKEGGEVVVEVKYERERDDYRAELMHKFVWGFALLPQG